MIWLELVRWIKRLPQGVLETDQRQVFDFDHLALLLQLAVEHALEHRTGHGQCLLVSVHGLVVDEEANIAQLLIVEQRLVSLLRVVRNALLSIHLV